MIMSSTLVADMEKAEGERRVQTLQSELQREKPRSK